MAAFRLQGADTFIGEDVLLLWVLESDHAERAAEWG